VQNIFDRQNIPGIILESLRLHCFHQQEPEQGIALLADVSRPSSREYYLAWRVVQQG
jgi:hypothetical protein